LTAAIGAARTQAQLESVDTTSSLTTALSGKQDTNAHLTAAIAAARTQAQLESLDTTSSLTSALALKANAAGLVGSGHAQFTNSASETNILSCHGNLGSTICRGGFKINMTRGSGPNIICATSGTGTLEFHSANSKALTLDTDQKATFEGNLSVAGAQIDFSGLPTSDPGVTGRLWNSSGTLKISA